MSKEDWEWGLERDMELVGLGVGHGRGLAVRSVKVQVRSGPGLV